MIKPDLTTPLPDAIGSIHFVGIGGSGMSGIAQLYAAAGHRVSGSDRSESPAVTELRRLGASVAIGHDAANIADDVDTVVVTSAIWPDNPELRAARTRGLALLHRSQALAWLTRSHRVVAVAGAHGKTTSTGMLTTMLTELGASPSFVNGGVVAGLGTSAASGRGDAFVLEADESDGSFLLYDTAVALVTNIEGDHIDHYGSAEALTDAFARFAVGARECAVLSADDPETRRIAERLDAQRVITFGTAADATVRVTDVDVTAPVRFVLHCRGHSYPCRLTVFGRHNALNAAGAVAAGVALGHEPEACVRAVAQFAGTARRFEWRGTRDGVRVYDDYAHHPTEVEAVLSAARAVSGPGRLIAVHQPHLYSRTQRLAGQFAETLERCADHTVVLDVCGAREDPVPGVTGRLVSERFDHAAHVHYAPEWSQAAAHIAEVAEPGDLVVTLGCGDVNLIVPQLLEGLEARPGRSIRAAP